MSLTQSSLLTTVTETVEDDEELENARLPTFLPPITTSILLLRCRLTPYSLYAAVSVGLEVLFL